jgi:hypothetical protein
MGLFSTKKKPFNTCKSNDCSRLLVAKRNYPSPFFTWGKQEFHQRSIARFLGLSAGEKIPATNLHRIGKIVQKFFPFS